MKPLFRFAGTGVALVTPFTSDDLPDLAALKAAVRRLIDGGVEYIVALGTTGEAATLTPDEKLKVLDALFEENNECLPVVLGIGGNHTREVCEVASGWTLRYPAAGILSVSPYYNKPSQEGIYQHYKAIAGATDLPLILYNVPPRTASNVSAETTLRLAHDCSNIVAIKEASGLLEQAMEIMLGKPDGFELLSGDDLLTLPLIALGAKGVISVSGNALPSQFSQMTRAALANDWATARRLQYELYPLIRLNFEEGNPTGVKTQLEALGICARNVRLPLTHGSSSLLEKMRAALSEKLLSA